MSKPRHQTESGFVPCPQACLRHSLIGQVEQWRAAGGRSRRRRHCRILAPAEVLSCWFKGIEDGAGNPVARDAFRFGLYTGLGRDAVLGLRWAQVDTGAAALTLEEAGSDAVPALPLVRQAGAILDCRLAARESFPEHTRAWAFPSENSPSGRFHRLQHLNGRIGETGGARFWFDALRRCFIAVAEDKLSFPGGPAASPVGGSGPKQDAEGSAAERSMMQLPEAAQRITDKIDELANVRPENPGFTDRCRPWHRRYNDGPRFSDG